VVLGLGKLDLCENFLDRRFVGLRREGLLPKEDSRKAHERQSNSSRRWLDKAERGHVNGAGSFVYPMRTAAPTFRVTLSVCLVPESFRRLPHAVLREWF
jgi:hypothetical protein